MAISKEYLEGLPSLGEIELIPYILYQKYYQEDEIYSFPVIMLGGHEVLQSGLLIEIDKSKINPGKFTEYELYGTEVEPLENEYFGELDEICGDTFITCENGTTRRIESEIPIEFIEKRGYIYYHKQAVKYGLELFAYLCPEVSMNLYTLEYTIIEN